MALHHFAVLVHKQAEKYGNKVALRYRNYETGKWIPITWNEFSASVYQAANAMLSLGVEVQENIGIFSQNKPESFFVDFAAFALRAVTIPLYATSSPVQAQYILDDSHIRYLFVGEQYQYNAAVRVMGLCKDLKQIIIYDRSVVKAPHDTNSIYFDEFLKLGEGRPYQAVVEERSAAATPDDVANILYTSGTTGEPKGVILPHSNWLFTIKQHELRLKMSDKDISMCFLPLTHVFERGWTYIALSEGMEVCINLKPADIQTTIREIRPTVMCSVPRFWEKVYIVVKQKIEQESGLKKKLFIDALRVGKIHNLDYARLNKKPPLWLHLKYLFYEKSIYSKMREIIGIDRGNFFPTAGAAVSNEVCEFARAVGINMVVGYGLTESTATVSCFPETHYEVGSVGEILPDLEVKIGENDEVLLRGETVMRGYYNKPEATAAALDADGWLHTGDSGYLKGRHLFLKERLKDLFKTSNGKYISPQALETKLLIDQFIDQVAVIADERKFVSALIVPNYAAVENYARKNGIAYDSLPRLLQSDAIHALFTDRIGTLQQEFAHYEQIKRFTLLPEPFSMEKGELTNTLKLRRPVVAEHFKDVIDLMYED